MPHAIVESRVEQREQKRIRVDEPAMVRHDRGTKKGLVRDISTYGAQLVLDESLEPESTVEITLDIVGKLRGRVKWQVGNRVGIILKPSRRTRPRRSKGSERRVGRDRHGQEEW